MHRLKRNIRIVFLLTGIGAVIASLVAVHHASLEGSVSFMHPLNGFVDGVIIAGLLSSYSFILMDILLREQTRRLGTAVLVVLNTLAYVLLIVVGRAVGRSVMNSGPFDLIPIDTEIQRIQFLQSIGFALIGSFVFHLFHGISQLLGGRELKSFLVGRYRHPKKEERVVMFLDLASSTTIAEQIGDAEFVLFLDFFFADLSEPVLASGAEIYKYVGDEVILTWENDARDDSAWCIFLREFNNRLEKRREFYLERFGFVPEYRAGVHAGTITSSQIGDLRKEIAHIGDVMNTTARIAAHCRVADARVLASRTVIRNPNDAGSGPTAPAGSGNAGQIARSIGPVTLRGKSESMHLYALEEVRRI